MKIRPGLVFQGNQGDQGSNYRIRDKKGGALGELQEDCVFIFDQNIAIFVIVIYLYQ